MKTSLKTSWGGDQSLNRPGLVHPTYQVNYKHNPFKYSSEYKRTEEFKADNDLFVDKNDALFKAAVQDERAAPLELLMLDS